MTLVTRAQWGARPRVGPATTVNIAARAATCVHHDGATPVVVHSFAEACARVRTDQNYHMDGNGWADIGYNYLVISAPGVAGVDGLIFEGRGRDVVGAHCLNHNTEWIGIQVAIGGAQKPSPAALASVRWLHDIFTVAAGHALGKKVHSDGFATACPGPELRLWAHAGMPVTTLTPTTTPEVDMPITQADADLFVRTLLTTELGRTGPNVAVALQHASASNVAAIAAAVVALLPAGGSGVTAAQIAKAVADEQARRLVA